MTTHVHFYFDFISPYAYFASRRVWAVAREHGATLHAHPILFAGLLKHHGQLGPAEIPSKRLFTFKDITRTAALHDIPLVGPARHPFNPLTALRLALPEVAGDAQWAVIDALYTAGWGEGADLGDADALVAALDAAEMDGASMLSRTRAPEVKAALRAGTEEAIARGVFGVPTYVVEREGAEDELVWGFDRLHHLALILGGEDPLDPALAADILARPGTHRAR